MKHTKKFASILLALVMAIAMAVPALATPGTGETETPPTTGSITILPKEDATGENTATYTYYQLFHATLAGENRASYYLLDSETALRNAIDALTITVDGQTYDVFTFTQSADGSQWNVSITAGTTIESTTDKEALAEALDGVKENALTSGTFSQGEDGATASNLPIGYYLVTSSLGTKLVLDTLGEVTVTTKNDAITSGKTASTTNMSVGDTVTYTITVDIPATAKVGDTVTVYDKLEDKAATALSVDDESIEASYTKEGEEQPIPVALGDGQKEAGDTNKYTFIKTFTITNDMLGQTVNVTYEAELTSDAADATGYVNSAYATVPGYKTESGGAKVYTFGFNLSKEFVGATDAEKADLEATFELYGEGEDAIEFVLNEDGSYVKADNDDVTKTTSLTVNGADSLKIYGLAAGTYIMKETATADGFNLLTKDVIVTITDMTGESETPSCTVTYKIGEDGEDQTGNVTIQNNSGLELPETGGMGTTIFYVVGSVMALGAVVLLVTKRRMGSK